MANLKSRLNATRAAATRKRNLRACLRRVSNSNKSLQEVVKLTNSAILITLESFQTAEASLQALTEIRVRTDALVARSRRQSGVVDLRRKLADLSFEAVDVRKEHEAALEDAWQGWRASMKNIVKAKQAHKEAKELINHAFTSALHSLEEGDAIHEVAEIVQPASNLPEENDELNLEIEANQETLSDTLKKIRDHEKAWEWVNEGVRKAAGDARKAIAMV